MRVGCANSIRAGLAGTESPDLQAEPVFALHRLLAPEVESAGEFTTSALLPHEIVRVSFGFEPGVLVPTRQDEMFAVVVRHSDLAGCYMGVSSRVHL